MRASDPADSGPSVSVHALGCKANQEEIECLLSRLTEAGYRVVPFGQPADWVVVNTCTVTAAGDSDSRQLIRRAARAREGGRIVVTGCMAQRDPAGTASLGGVDWVVGNGEKPYLARWILEADAGDRPTRDPSDGPGTGGPGAPDPGKDRGDDRPPPWIRVGADPTLSRFAAFGSGTAGRRTRAALKIQDGCDEHCTFCVIPEVRGGSRSRSREDVLRQVGRLVASGYREVALTGINTALWGHDLSSPAELPDLLEALDRIPGLERVRLNSLEPQYVTAAWVSRFAALGKLCRHFHLPLQSGDPDILRRMNRRYDPGCYAELFRSVRLRMPDAAIGADVLIGFPGETEEAFEGTLAVLEEVRPAYLHVFAYSVRPGTPAPRMGDPVPVSVRKERSTRLRRLDRRLRREFAESQVGSIQKVLPEGASGEGWLQGLTGNYLRVRFPRVGSVAGAGATPSGSAATVLTLLQSVEEDGMILGEPVEGWDSMHDPRRAAPPPAEHGPAGGRSRR